MDETITRGTDNVFADLGFPDAASHKLKAELVTQIRALVGERQLNQAEAGSIMGISQPEVSRLFKGRFREVSVERLMGMLQRLDCDVDIVVNPMSSRLKFGAIHLPARSINQTNI
jgi:predicted XRE-type DNA-binding protein